MNRGGLRSSVLDLADARGSGHWDASPGGEVDQRISGVYDKIWHRILNANRFYRVSKRTPTSDAVTGRYALSDLTGSSTDTLERFFRVLTVVIDDRPYREEKLTDWSLVDTVSQGDFGGFAYYLEGQNLNAIPTQLGKSATIWVNWIPQRPAALTTDAVAVDFPDGYDEVLVHLGAARLLMKAGEESQAAAALRLEIQPDYDEMLSDLARFSTNPLFFSATDSAIEWGGF